MLATLLALLGVYNVGAALYIRRKGELEHRIEERPMTPEETRSDSAMLLVLGLLAIGVAITVALG